MSKRVTGSDTTSADLSVVRLTQLKHVLSERDADGFPLPGLNSPLRNFDTILKTTAHNVAREIRLWILFPDTDPG